MPSVAQLIATTLVAAEVEVVFGLPGIHNIALWPELDAQGIRVVGARHEQGTAYAADGFARTTGKLGVALTTTGPGAANTLAAVGEAWASRVPVLVISTDIASTGRRPGVFRGFVHECMDQQAMFGPVTKSSFHASSPRDVLDVLRQAIGSALTPPRRPVYVGIPTDFLAAEIDYDVVATVPTVVPPPPASVVGQAAAMLERAERPVIWAGGGAHDAGQALGEVALRLGAPVINTFMGRGVLATDHPALLELPPHESEVSALIQNADVGLFVGSDLDQYTTQEWRLPLPQQRIAINVDPADASKNVSYDLVVAADASQALQALAPLLRLRTPWQPEAASMRGRFLERLAADEKTREAADWIASLDGVLPRDAIVFADMAIAGYWVSAYTKVWRTRSLHFPMGWGTLGYALPAAMGAAAAGTRPSVAITGDGGILFALGELATLAQERLPVTVVVVDNGGYGALRYGHGLSLDKCGTELKVPDFARIAEGFSLAAQRTVGVGAEFRAALGEGLASGQPNLVITSSNMPPPATMSPLWPLRRQALPTT